MDCDNVAPVRGSARQEDWDARVNPEAQGVNSRRTTYYYIHCVFVTARTRYGYEDSSQHTDSWLECWRYRSM